jgi:glycosyltransferase involved in cell wall biosynthesis
MFFVSVIIPCRNEKSFISKCLDSLVGQDYPKESLEIFIIDGKSEDGTREIIRDYVKKYPFIRLLDNPNKFTPFGLNIGLRQAKGDIIVRMDAHAEYEKNYISQCLKYLDEYKTDGVGGIIKTIPSKDNVWAKAIAIVLSHPFGAGSSFFRIGSKKPKWVDTVFGGCYKKEVFEKIGFFNEKLIRSQDIEFNHRLKKAGGKILLVPDIKIYYYPQSNFKNFLKHNFNDGVWTIYPLKFGIKIFSLRHLIPLIFILFLFVSVELSPFLFFFILSFYFFINILFSFLIAVKEKNLGLLITLPFVFANRHFGYGFGSFFGLIKTLL